MATTAAHVRASNKYNAKAYDSLRIVVPKGRKADIEKVSGGNINGFVNELIRNALGMTVEQWKEKDAV